MGGGLGTWRSKERFFPATVLRPLYVTTGNEEKEKPLKFDTKRFDDTYRFAGH